MNNKMTNMFFKKSKKLCWKFVKNELKNVRNFSVRKFLRGMYVNEAKTDKFPSNSKGSPYVINTKY